MLNQSVHENIEVQGAMPGRFGGGFGGYVVHHSSKLAVAAFIIALFVAVIILFGWLDRGHRGFGCERERGENGYYDRDGYDRDYYRGYGRGGYYQDKCYELGDKLVQSNSERYADHVGWQTLDRANAYSTRELSQYANFNKQLTEKDLLIAKLYTDGKFDKAECGISHCVKEIPGMVNSNQIVAPIGPTVKRPEFEMICNERRDCDDRFRGKDFEGRSFVPPYGYPPVTPPIISTPPTIPVTVYPQPFVTTTAP